MQKGQENRQMVCYLSFLSSYGMQNAEVVHVLFNIILWKRRTLWKRCTIFLCKYDYVLFTF